jgi:soluble lytic murein transglycosylase
MRIPIRVAMAGSVLLLSGGVHAQDPNPLTAVRADHWTEAQVAAARFADPVAEKLVLYLRLRAPGAATAAEIADFMQRNPDWPAQAMLERRRQEAIATEPDDAAVLSQCSPAPTLAAAMLRCAEAIANAGRATDADALARQAWVNEIDSATGEAAFLRRWGGIASADDQWARFQRLAWLSDPAAAARQIARLTGSHHTAAEARLAAKRDDPQTESLVAVLPPALQVDPGLVLDRVRALRRADRDPEAAALMGRIAESANVSEFWSERNVLARKLLHDGDAKTAYNIVTGHGQIADEQRAEADFFAGFIALRMLHDAATAEKHFRSLADSHSVITQSRAHYWLARTAAAGGRDARPEYAKSAAWPTTFYGQLAALALGETPASLIAKLHDPGWTQDTALAFTGHEVLRAAAWLIAWGDPQRARVFLTRMDELAPIPAERALTAAFAAYAGMPDGAVFVARRMGRDGIALPHLGWPMPYNPAAPPDPAFSLGIMRQESSFDVGAVSPSGARGLMQLMPPTASAVAKELGILASVPTLTVDASHNIRLGTAYLQEVLTRFDSCLPLAAAAYNAGPHRVVQWLADNGDPRIGPVDMVDWIELIPVGETRNYVQRVTENVVMYRASRNDPTPILPAATPWTR